MPASWSFSPPTMADGRLSVEGLRSWCAQVEQAIQALQRMEPDRTGPIKIDWNAGTPLFSIDPTTLDWPEIDLPLVGDQDDLALPQPYPARSCIFRLAVPDYGWTGSWDGSWDAGWTGTGSPITITGLDATWAYTGTPGGGVYPLLLWNVGDGMGTGPTISISSEDTGSATADRFHLRGGKPLVLAEDDWALATYDQENQRWRVLQEDSSWAQLPFPGFDGSSQVYIASNDAPIAPDRPTIYRTWADPGTEGDITGLEAPLAGAIYPVVLWNDVSPNNTLHLTNHDARSQPVNRLCIMTGNTQTVDCDTTNGSSTVSVPIAGGLIAVKFLTLGMTVVGSGIPSGTTVTAVNEGANTITISQDATADGSGVTLTFTSGKLHIDYNDWAWCMYDLTNEQWQVWPSAPNWAWVNDNSLGWASLSCAPLQIDPLKATVHVWNNGSSGSSHLYSYVKPLNPGVVPVLLKVEAGAYPTIIGQDNAYDGTPTTVDSVTTISGSSLLTAPGSTGSCFAANMVGSLVSGTGIAANSFVAAYISPTEAVLNTLASASGTITLTVVPSYVIPPGGAALWFPEQGPTTPYTSWSVTPLGLTLVPIGAANPAVMGSGSSIGIEEYNVFWDCTTLYIDTDSGLFLANGDTLTLVPPYTATTPSDWAGGSPPTTLQSALDRIAAALTALGHSP